MNRRQLLAALGLGAGGLALGGISPIMRPRRVQAQDAGPIRRLLIISNGHGNVHENFRMTFSGRPDTAQWEAPINETDAWSPILAPLQRHSARLNVLDGLSLATPELDLPGYRHEKGWIHAWTGNLAELTGRNLFATTPSLDQLVAREIARMDRLPSIELSIDDGRPVSHAGRQQQLPMEESPIAAYNRLFGADTGAIPGTAAAVLDFAQQEYALLGAGLSPADSLRAEQHRTLIEGLRGRLQGLSTLGCEGEPPLMGEGYDDAFDAHIDVITAAFTCDVTRVATLSLGDLPPSALPFQPTSGNVHDSWAHELYAREEAKRGMTAYMAVHAAQIARLLDRLEAIEDPQGGSLLDHTLVAWGSEMADGWHGYERYCVVLAGGGWAWPTGRYLHFPYRTGPITVVAPDGKVRSGVPHQHLLVSLAKAMGLDVDAVGLSSIMTRDGELVDLTGALEGL